MSTAKVTNHPRSRADIVAHFLNEADKVILGKRHQIKLALCTILAEGHLLIEDVPGVGKTTLVKMLGKALGLDSFRIQFTNDLLPSDIIGTAIFDTNEQRFRFHRGPIFGQLIIADELNRATPKTQSAFLQAMEERRVTVDGVNHSLPSPFVVVATQNPKQQTGTYPLPESQLDRFLMRIHLGYPEDDAERQLLKGERRQVLLDDFKPILSPEDVVSMQKETEQIIASDAVIDYVQRILRFSRTQSSDQWGLSPRAGLALLRSAKSWAYLEGREMVLPDDVQAVAVNVMAHRLNCVDDPDSSAEEERAKQILSSVRVD